MRRREITGFGFLCILLVSLFLSPIYPPNISTWAFIHTYTLDVRVGLQLYYIICVCVSYSFLMKDYVIDFKCDVYNIMHFNIIIPE